MLLNTREFRFNPSNPTEQTLADPKWHSDRKKLLNQVFADIIIEIEEKMEIK